MEGSPEPYVALLCRLVMNEALQTTICAWKASRAVRRHDWQPAYGAPPPPPHPSVMVVVVVRGVVTSPRGEAMWRLRHGDGLTPG